MLVCAGLLMAVSTLLWQARERSLRAAESETRNIVGMLTQHTERTFDSVDMLLKMVARELGPRPEDPIRRSELSGKLAQLAQDLPHVMSLRLLDPEKAPPLFEFFRTAATGRNADMQALKAHKADQYLGLHIGRPYFDGVSKVWAVAASRRVSGQEGVPGLVVIAVLNLEYLHKFYASIDMGADGSISIIRTDGIMIARRPFNPGSIGKDVSRALWPNVGDRSDGNYRIAALTDSITRIYGFRRLDRMPLVITAGLSEQTILAEWRSEAVRSMVSAGSALLILLVLGEALARVVGHREKAEQDLIFAASHDSLTGLYNRREFLLRLDASFGRVGSPLCVVLVDLDDFKTINDTLGHDAGDALLNDVAARLKKIVPKSGAVARLGGDEFALAVPGELDEGREIAGSILAALRDPFRHGTQTVITGASIGIALFPEHGRCANDLLKNADIALYSAKANGRARYAVFETAMRTEIVERLALFEEVEEGIRQDWFIPFYQPQISVRNGEVQGFEALARWRHPQRGLLGPAVFGRAFDNHELAIAMGRRLFAQVLADIKTWRQDGVVFGRVAVNASAAELDHPDYAAWMLTELRSMSVAPNAIEVEVTEGVLFGKSADRVHANLLALHRAGIRIGLDDFGTGYASLTHLKQFPISVLKIDRSFVHNLEISTADASIVAAVVGLAKALSIEVVAEGVERPSQLDFLDRIGCTSAQGYLFAKPMAASRIKHFLEQHLVEFNSKKLGARA